MTALSLRLADLFGVASFVVDEAEDVERHGNIDEGVIGVKDLGYL